MERTILVFLQRAFGLVDVPRPGIKYKPGYTVDVPRNGYDKEKMSDLQNPAGELTNILREQKRQEKNRNRIPDR